MPVRRSAPADLEPIEKASRDEIAALQLQRAMRSRISIDTSTFRIRFPSSTAWCCPE